jgi:hypothetical protein
MIQSRAKPKLGLGMFRYFPDTRHFEADLAACCRALNLAQQLGDRAMIAETRVIGGYVEMMRQLYAIASIRGESKQAPAVQEATLHGRLEALRRAGSQVVAALDDWRAAAAPDCQSERFVNGRQATQKVVKDVCILLGE